jgi:ubiquinone/menaquinone biosynthesis C-methylase UbiE
VGFYSRKIFPYLLDFSMSASNLNEYRRSLLAHVRGEVLEIGFGTGLNLAYYPPEIREITAIDANPGVVPLAEKRLKSSSVRVEYRVLNGESLPIADNTFDTVVSTWTLCSIARVENAIAEIHRVLKPGGKFVFIEHGRSPDPQINLWQNRLTPLQKIVGDGCHLNRQIQQLVATKFPEVEVEEFYDKKLPKLMGYFYRGIAIKSS